MSMTNQESRLFNLKSKAMQFINSDISDILKVCEVQDVQRFNVNLQQFWSVCEKITKYIFHNKEIQNQLSNILNKNIEHLQTAGYIPADVASCIHLIRVYSNKFRHADAIEHNEADCKIILEALIKILIWFNATFSEPAPQILNQMPILMYSDTPELYSRKLINHIFKAVYRDIIYINDARELLSREIDPKKIIALALLVTDVTKLSEDEKTRQEINSKIEEYVKSGGILIATSDVIFRRTDNKKLQEIFGCKIDNYKKYDSPIKYKKTEACKQVEFFKDLPDEFYLSEGVVNWGEWSKDCTVLFETDDPNFGSQHPLVVLKKYGSGTCLWLNGGETRDHPPKSIALPEKPFVDLIRAFVKYVNAGNR